MRVAIVGGGIVGLATAYKLLQAKPDWAVSILEKEDDVGQHQSGHNSGVLHAGLYYASGSNKHRGGIGFLGAHHEEVSSRIARMPGLADTANGLRPVSRSSITVLVVEDDRSLREGCVSYFQVEGYDVTSVGSGTAALDLVRRRRFDLAMLDLYITEVPGLEILRARSIAPHQAGWYLALRASFDAFKTAVQQVRSELEIFSYPTAIAQMARLVNRAIATNGRRTHGSRRSVW